MTTTTFDPSQEGPTAAEKEAEVNALAQGEKLAQAAEEDRAKKFEQVDANQEDIALIGGKFKSQDDLLNAYKQLEQKLGSKDQEDGDEATEEPTEAVEEGDEKEPETAVDYMNQLNTQYEETGELTEESIDRLSQMDSKDLINTYLQYYKQQNSNNQQAQLQQDAINEIKQSVGGDDAYSEMMEWASGNLDATEITQYNQVTESGNPAAIKFAVEALTNRFRSKVGYEAPLVTGRKASTGVRAYRSQAELGRDIANPLYSSDPAFRADVEARLSKSKDLL